MITVIIVAWQEADEAAEQLLLLARRCATDAGKDECLHCLLHSGLPLLDAITPGGLPSCQERTALQFMAVAFASRAHAAAEMDRLLNTEADPLAQRTAALKLKINLDASLEAVSNFMFESNLA